MNYYDIFMADINKQVEDVKFCKGYEAFKEDIKRLIIAITGCGLTAIAAEVWLKQICELSTKELVDYVENYKKGTLDVWKLVK